MMKQLQERYWKGAWNVLWVYLSSVFLFTFFLIAPVSMDNTHLWISIYSVIFFLFLFSFLYKKMRETASKENHPVNREHHKPYPLKGLVYGALGFLPLVLFEVLYFAFHNPDSIGIGMYAFHVAFRCLFGPMYFIIRGLGFTWYAYLAANLVVPLLAMLGYLAGYYNFEIMNARKEQVDKEDFLQ